MAAPIFVNYNGPIATANSGIFRFGERIYYTEEIVGTVADVRSYGSLHPRGSIYTIIGLAGAFVVDECNVAPEKGGIAKVTVVYCWLNSVPPDQWSVTPFENNPPIERAAFFTPLQEDATHFDLSIARLWYSGVSTEVKNAARDAAAAKPNAALIASLVGKWHKGEENFYVAGLKYQWTKYYTTLSGVLFRQGGYIETPGGPGTVPNDMQWLRQCDELAWNNGLYSVTRTWIGYPKIYGGWDTDIYGTTPI